MAPNSYLHSSTGLPVCLSGITNPLAFSREIADHDRRRKVFRKMKTFRVREDEEIRSTHRRHERIIVVAGDGDGASGDLAPGTLHDLSCTAKAA